MVKYCYKGTLQSVHKNIMRLIQPPEYFVTNL